MLEKINKRIMLITTGGTIDSDPYPDDPSQAPVNASFSANTSRAIKIAQDLITTHPAYKLDTIQYSLKDSKHLTRIDLQKILEHIKKYEDKTTRIVITTGTDKMCELAINLKEIHPQPICTIVLTGAFHPLSNGEKSDGTQNLKKALFEQPDATPDIYIAMNEHFSAPDRIIKDFQQKKFVLKKQP